MQEALLLEQDHGMQPMGCEELQEEVLQVLHMLQEEGLQVLQVLQVLDVQQ